MAESITNRGAYRLIAASLDAAAALDLRVGLVLGTTTGIHNKDLNTVADLDAVSGVSLHSERLALTGEAVTEDDTEDRAEIDSSNPSFAAAPGVTAVAMFLYDEGNGTDSGRDLIAVYSTGFPQPVDGGLNVTVNDLIRGTPS